MEQDAVDDVISEYIEATEGLQHPARADAGAAQCPEGLCELGRHDRCAESVQTLSAQIDALHSRGQLAQPRRTHTRRNLPEFPLTASGHEGCVRRNMDMRAALRVAGTFLVSCLSLFACGDARVAAAGLADGSSSTDHTAAAVGEAAPSNVAVPASSLLSASDTVSLSITSLLAAVVTPCAAGYAHPNICCRGAPYEATTCTKDSTHPFDVCATGLYAYPDPSACCLLADKNACTGPSGDASAMPESQGASCQNPCAPGAYPPSKISISPAGVAVDDMLCCFGTGLACEPKQPPCIGLCTEQQEWCGRACPSGWTVPVEGQVDACCQSDSSGRSFCFSQAEHIRSPGGGAAVSDPSGCVGDHLSDDGNSYVMICDYSATPSCKCLSNGIVTRSLSDDTKCLDYVACGFPQ